MNSTIEPTFGLEFNINVIYKIITSYSFCSVISFLSHLVFNIHYSIYAKKQNLQEKTIIHPAHSWTSAKARESIKTTSRENVSTGVIDENKEHYLRCKDKAEKSYDVLRNTQFNMSKYKKNEDLQSMMSNLQANCCLKVNFQKMDQNTWNKWLIHDTKHCKDNQLQSLKLPCRIS